MLRQASFREDSRNEAQRAPDEPRASFDLGDLSPRLDSRGCPPSQPKEVPTDIADNFRVTSVSNPWRDHKHLLKRIAELEQDGAMSELKIKEQESQIGEQFEIIQDYAGQIEEQARENRLLQVRVKELEGEIQRVLDLKCSTSVDMAEWAKNSDK